MNIPGMFMHLHLSGIIKSEQKPNETTDYTD